MFNGRTLGQSGESGQVGREDFNNYGVWSQATSSPWDIPPPRDYTSPPQDYIQPPIWADADLSDPACSWDLDLSQQLASKLLLLESRQEESREDLSTEQSPTLSNPRFKTEICRNFKEKGACMYGGLCQFAHGKHELRQDMVRHTRYKTKLCQKYWIAGYCAYGPRCNFVHKELEKQCRGGQDFYPEVTTITTQPSAESRRPASGFTRSRHTPSTLVRNVSDVIRISKSGSQGDSGGDSGSELVGAHDIWRGSMKPQGPTMESGLEHHYRSTEEQRFAANWPIGSERNGMRTLWPKSLVVFKEKV